MNERMVLQMQGVLGTKESTGGSLSSDQTGTGKQWA